MSDVGGKTRPVALVTGASAGLGEVFARRLAERGYDLVLVARRADRLEKLAEDLETRQGASSLVLGVDLQGADGAQEVFRRVTEKGLAVDILVNNAGFGRIGDFVQGPLDRELGQIDLNVRALVALTRLFLPAMVERRAGTVMNIASVAGFLPVPFMATYAATKAFVVSFTEALVGELSGSGVHAMVVCPGGTHTEFQAVSGFGSKAVEPTFMTAQAVVDIALADWDRGRHRSVTGLINKVQVCLIGLLPRFVVNAVTRLLFVKFRAAQPQPRPRQGGA